jgi:pyruvate,orthophosphate dikinase
MEHEMDAKYVYFFGGNLIEGDATMVKELGGKGANLAEMTTLGLPVPPGFTITCQTCLIYQEQGSLPPDVMKQVRENIKHVESLMGQEFGGSGNPLLFSVRSGAPVSMPGMMDTVLNLGLNAKSLQGMIQRSGNPRFVLDSYRRFIQMFGDVVKGISHDTFESLLSNLKFEKGIRFDNELSEEHLSQLIQRYKDAYIRAIGEEFSEDPYIQLEQSIEAVFGSWNNARAIKYRSLHHIRDDMGTAVNVQAMVFGNFNQNSGTGVAFTRNPATGEDVFYGEYLMNAQGEDVVAGIRTPQPINPVNKVDQNQKTLEELMPEVYQQLDRIRLKLDDHYRDMQDLEFTIQDGTLYILQTRSGKRTAPAAIKIALDYLRRRMINEKEALLRVETTFIDQLLHKQLDPDLKYKAVATGLPAGPGAAVGQVVFDAETAVQWHKKGARVVLVRNETTPEDISGMNAAQGILTAMGGMTSHAALVARGMGKTCIVGCNTLKIDLASRTATIGRETIKEGDYLTLAVGKRGEVILGELPLVEPKFSEDFAELLSIADRHRKLGVRANADTIKDSQQARQFGAGGIGLCRTEHMFFEGNRILAMREMILAETVEARKRALEKLLPLQQGDFEGIFEAMDGLPVTIRLLDPPLHEFLPRTDHEIAELAEAIGMNPEVVKRSANRLHEMNPMLGHRGCRLLITYPEICEMQVRAIIGAAIRVASRGIKVHPEIMVPLVGHVNEIRYLKKIICSIADEMVANSGMKLKFSVGTMIEVPRAAVAAGEIAGETQFFSFGTNDLTQMGFGFSRDDIGSFIPEYRELGILPDDPFEHLDQPGIGKLMEYAVTKGREAKPGLKVGICGEHGGDPSSIEFFHKIKLDYVSCSPFRVPIARLAAAQAAIRAEKNFKPTASTL